MRNLKDRYIVLTSTVAGLSGPDMKSEFLHMVHTVGTDSTIHVYTPCTCEKITCISDCLYLTLCFTSGRSTTDNNNFCSQMIITQIILNLFSIVLRIQDYRLIIYILLVELENILILTDFEARKFNLRP